MVEFGPDGAFTALDNGEARIGARSAGLLARTTLLVSPSSVRLTAPAVYLNQAIQRLDGTVPLIAGRKALLRVFVTGDEISYYEPRAFADFLLGGVVIHTAPMDPPHVIPDAVDEKWRLQSFNAEIPGEVIRPGVELSVEMDPDGVVPLRPGSERRFPAEGTLPLNVVELPVHFQTLVPVIAATDPREQIRIWAQGHDRGERVAPVRAQRSPHRRHAPDDARALLHLCGPEHLRGVAATHKRHQDPADHGERQRLLLRSLPPCQPHRARGVGLHRLSGQHRVESGRYVCPRGGPQPESRARPLRRRGRSGPQIPLPGWQHRGLGIQSGRRRDHRSRSVQGSDGVLQSELGQRLQFREGPGLPDSDRDRAGRGGFCG